MSPKPHSHRNLTRNIEQAQAYQLYQAAELLMQEKFGEELKKIARELKSPATAPATAR